MTSPGDLAHHAAAAGEVGRSVGERDAAGVARARIEPERYVVRVALGREVHLPDHRLEHGAEAPCASARCPMQAAWRPDARHVPGSVNDS